MSDLVITGQACTDIKRKSIKPFLKWAGGKTQLLAELNQHVPNSYGTYIEPFIGGGAFYFHLNPEKALIADANEELVITYSAIRDEVEEVINILGGYSADEASFYQIRALDTVYLTNAERAARLIYLNKTCFNGLYRVNKKGQFNVPYGKKMGGFLNATLLKEACLFLQTTTIEYSDYLKVTAKAQGGDFIFLDPPYHPVDNVADFKRYTKEFFYTNDQIRLKEEFDRLVSLGCKVLLTNSAHPFILDLFKDYEIKIVETRRMISSKATTRKGQDIIVLGC